MLIPKATVPALYRLLIYILCQICIILMYALVIRWLRGGLFTQLITCTRAAAAGRETSSSSISFPFTFFHTFSELGRERRYRHGNQETVREKWVMRLDPAQSCLIHLPVVT